MKEVLSVSREGDPRSALDILVPGLYLIGLCGFGLVSFLPDILRLENRDITIPYRAIALAYACAVILKGMFNKRIRPSFGMFLFALFWCLYTARLVNDTLFVFVQLARPVEMYYLYAFGIVLIPSIGFLARTDSQGLRRSLVAVLISGSAILILAVFYDVGGFMESGRLAGNTTLNPISLGHVGVTVVVLGAYYYATRGGRGSWTKAGSAAACALGLVAVFMSGSRGPVTSLLVVVVIAVLSIMGRGTRVRIGVLVGALVVMSPWIVDRVVEHGGAIEARVTSLRDVRMKEEDVRVILWQEGWQEFLRSPLVGSGLDIPGFGYPHNMVIEGYMSTGILGGTVLLFLLTYGFIKGIFLLRMRGDVGWLGLLYIQYLVGGMFSGTIYDNYELWYMFAAVIAASSSIEGTEGRGETRTHARSNSAASVAKV